MRYLRRTLCSLSLKVYGTVNRYDRGEIRRRAGSFTCSPRHGGDDDDAVRAAVGSNAYNTFLCSFLIIRSNVENLTLIKIKLVIYDAIFFTSG